MDWNLINERGCLVTAAIVHPVVKLHQQHTLVEGGGLVGVEGLLFNLHPVNPQ